MIHIGYALGIGVAVFLLGFLFGSSFEAAMMYFTGLAQIDLERRRYNEKIKRGE